MTIALLTSCDAYSYTTSVDTNATDYIYETGVKPVISLSINELDGGGYLECSLELLTDKRQQVTTLIKNVAVGNQSQLTVDFTLPISTPGFYICRLKVDGNQVDEFHIGYDPFNITYNTRKPDDFDQFWNDVKAELAATDMNLRMTLLPHESTSRRNVWLVEMESIPDEGTVPVTVRGYYAEPTDGSDYPCIVHFHGYDGGTSAAWIPTGDENIGWCDFWFSIRGQSLNNREPFKDDGARYGNDYISYNFGDKDHYYYRGAYADVIRAIDFVSTRSKVNQNNIFVEGESQGGMLSMVATGLDDRVNAAAVAIPFLCDLPDLVYISDWPSSPIWRNARLLGMNADQMLTFLSYFDVANIATLVNRPVICTISMEDNIVAPRSAVAMLGNLATAPVSPSGDPQVVYNFNPRLSHQTPSGWWPRFYDFFRSHFRQAPTSVSAPDKDSESPETRFYDLQGRAVDTQTKGIVVSEKGKTMLR